MLEKFLSRTFLCWFVLGVWTFALGQETVIVETPFKPVKTVAEASQIISLAGSFRKGKVRFIPEVTITEDSMGGKAFFSLLYDIALDEKGDIYASDSKEGNIKKFDASGSFLGTIGISGQGPGELNLPGDIEWSKGRLYVHEMMNMRFSIFDGDGHFVASVPYNRSEGRVQSMRALPDGRFIIEKEKDNPRDSGAPQEVIIELYSSGLKFIRTIYRHEVRIRKYILEPQRTPIPIPFSPRVYWDVLPNGKVIICYSGEYEIEIHDPDQGRISSFSHTFAPIKVDAKDKELYFERLISGAFTTGGTISQQRGAPNHIVKNTEFPRYKPPFIDLKVDAQGNIWVVPSRAADGKRLTMDVFESGGRFISSVIIDKGDRFPNRMVALPEGFWTLEVKAGDEWIIVKYRISD